MCLCVYVLCRLRAKIACATDFCLLILLHLPHLYTEIYMQITFLLLLSLSWKNNYDYNYHYIDAYMVVKNSPIGRVMQTSILLLMH